MFRLLVSLLVAVALAACGPSTPASDAKQTADALTGDSKGAANLNPLCKLFTPAELEAYVGEPLGAPDTAAMGTGCQWLANDNQGNVLLQIVPKSYHRDPHLADGYKKLPDLGVESNVAPDMGGWIAATIVGEESIIASVAGKSASEAQAVALLRETIKRHSGSPS